MFDPDLQKAAAGYARAKTVEVYANLSLAVAVLLVIAVAGIKVIQSVINTFGL